MSLAEKFVEAIDPATHIVRAFGLPDLQDKGLWLVEQLRPILPGQQDPQIFNWLRSVIDAPDYHFVRTTGAFALTEIKRERMMVQPFALDHFVLIEEGADISEAEALYLDMKRWAFGLGASDLELNPRHLKADEIERVLGKVRKREVLFVKLGK